ncbi:hypothetical protein HYN59_16745 [Flavobacterium album]|uniref:Uncharacterized protein n=1 Tax=Flavobacterium album TaxID=2175091 RepID=A0A2S1R1R1_9FLAO|nr:COR domain-containing protein [Flavobacterium album]AWH86653.1 hypothetical protein HYN59_16745 [Flavobacterium album]
MSKSINDIIVEYNLKHGIAEKYLKIANIEYADFDSNVDDHIISFFNFQFLQKNQQLIALEDELNISLFRISEKDTVDPSKLSKIPPKNYYYISDDKKVIGLNLSGNNFDSIEFISQFKELEELNLNDNKIQNLSPLAKLTRLKHLQLDNNLIITLEYLRDLKALEFLTLSNNKIESVNWLTNLTKLVSLKLNGNKIKEFKQLVDLPKLLNLDLSSNEISNVSYVTNFEEIAYNLQDNKISKVPDSFFIKKTFINYKRLRHSLLHLLYVALNSSKLDSGFINNVLDLQEKTDGEVLKNTAKYRHAYDRIYNTYFTLIFNSYFEKNPIISPPLEIILEGEHSVFRYFERRDTQEREFIYDAKVTIVGEGSAGKTSLQTRLLDPQNALPKYEERTRGIKVVEYNFENFKAHIWDFGGQDVYYPVHRFFLTSDSVYVLVAATRGNVHNFEYWIPTIYQFGGNSPIIIVQNCFDGITANWNNILSIFYSNPDYNILKPYSQINLPNNNEGLEGAKNIIEETIKKLPLIGKEVVKSWVKVRDKVIEISETSPCLSFDQFRDLCREIDIEYDTNHFSDIKEIVDIGKFLHKLGIILWFNDTPLLRSYIVIKPEWLMNAVYFILDEKKSEKGFLTSVEFDEIWNDKSYIDKRDFLKSILEQFKIAFPKKSKLGEYIIPSKLKSLSDSDQWKIDINNKCIRLEYEFDFLPYGLTNQVSSDLSKYITSDDSVWFNAANFKKNDSHAQIEENRIKRMLLIKARGNDARDLVAMIMKSIDDVIDEYRGVNLKIKVLCNCNVCIGLQNPMEFDYDKIKEWINLGKDEKTCLESDEKINIRNLIYDAGFDYISKHDMLKILQENKTMKNKSINISPIINNNPQFSQNNNINIQQKIDIQYSSEFEIIKEILLDLKDEAKDNKLWQETLIECLDHFNRIEYAEDKPSQKTSLSIIERGFKKLKDLKDIVAISFLSVDIEKKFPDLLSHWEAFKSIF